MPATDQIVTALPEVTFYQRTDDDEFLILACDGLWDVMTEQEVANFVFKFANGKDTSSSLFLAELSDEIVQEAMQLGSRDNISVITVKLKPPIQGRKLFNEIN